MYISVNLRRLIATSLDDQTTTHMSTLDLPCHKSAIIFINEKSDEAAVLWYIYIILLATVRAVLFGRNTA